MRSHTPTWLMHPGKRQHGFTLIELMIVVSIIALISALAIPAIKEYMYKSRRNDGRNLLLAIVAKQEQFRPNNRSYTSNFTQLGVLPAKTISSDTVTSENGYYSVTINVPATCSRTDGRILCYELTATPISTQKNDACNTLTIDDNGIRGFTPSDAKGCW